MRDFIYSYPTKVYFGEKAAEKALPIELSKVGKTVMFAYGGGSVKKSGVYDEVCGLLKEAGKEIVDFAGGLYALYLLCDQSDPGVLVYQKEPVSADL